MADDISQHSTSCKSAKDCRTCRVRRILCDRTLPHCLKCAKQKRDCPGYGPNIRWTNAVAVRGHLRGMTVPSASDNRRIASPSASATVSSSASLPSSWAEAAISVANLLPEAPAETEIRHMVQYYGDKIAGNMIWIDHEQNPYRQLMIPLSKSQPVILLAIIAVSAGHRARSQQSHSLLAERARNVAVSKISQVLRQVTETERSEEGLNAVLDLKAAESILASMLILTNYECTNYASTAWRLHRQGARTLINALPVINNNSSELLRFLRNQFCIYDVLASTTTHRYMSIDDVVLPEIQDPAPMFSEYLRLVHQVDLFSRQGRSTRSDFMRPDLLRMKFEMARGSTLMDAGRIQGLDTTARNDFISLVDLYHHAAMLYSYRCAYGYTSSHQDMITSSRLLFERLKHVVFPSRSAPSLPWPVFVAGVESYETKERQELVTTLLETIIEATGFSNYSMLSSFLQFFWSGGEPNWLKVMEVWESQGRYLLPV